MPVEAISRPVVGLPRPKSRAQRLASTLYQRVRAFDEPPAIIPTPATEPVPITLVCISDTHNTKPSALPPGDILLHAGDLSQFGTFAEVQAQLSWISAQPHPHKIVVAGNHDLILDPVFTADHPDRELDRHPGKRRADLDWGDVRYLQHEVVDIEVRKEGKARSVRIFGSPWTPRCGSWAFQYGKDGQWQQGGDRVGWASSVPPGTNVVLTHGPPKGHLDDGGNGCDRFLAELWRARPGVAVFGHIHAGRGEEWLFFDRAQAWYEAAVSRRRAWVSVACLAVYCLWLLLTRRLGLTEGGRNLPRGTHLVNAAVVGGRGNREVRDAIVAVI